MDNSSVKCCPGRRVRVYSPVTTKSVYTFAQPSYVFQYQVLRHCSILCFRRSDTNGSRMHSSKLTPIRNVLIVRPVTCSATGNVCAWGVAFSIRVLNCTFEVICSGYVTLSRLVGPAFWLNRLTGPLLHKS